MADNRNLPEHSAKNGCDFFVTFYQYDTLIQRNMDEHIG